MYGAMTFVPPSVSVRKAKVRSMMDAYPATDVSLVSVINSLPSVGMTFFIACGMTMRNIVVV